MQEVEIAHIGGAVIGYIFIKQLQNGNNMGDPIIKILSFIKNLKFEKKKLNLILTKKKLLVMKMIKMKLMSY